MMTLKSPREIEHIRAAGAVVAACHKEIRKMIKPGVTTWQIEELVEDVMASYGARPFTKTYKDYKFATCASVNDVIAHGFPSHTPLKNGDIVTIDTVAELNGWLGDSAWTYAVGELSPKAKKLMRVTKECLDIGIRHAIIGNRIGDAMYPLQKHAEANGFSCVRELAAHGIGMELHEEPSFLHVGQPGKGFRFKEGMVITIEPMINEGTWRMMIDEDGWTARTMDGKLSAQFEHTIAITKDGPVILTSQDE